MKDKIIECYTDGGSRRNGQTNNVCGWGVYLKYGDYEKKISGGVIHSTNNIMELTAILEGMKAIKNKNIKTIIYSDSQYSINCLIKWFDGWKRNNWRTSDKKPVKNRDLIIALDKERNKFRDIYFQKVKGHNGIEGNEIVDSLCNMEMDKLEKEILLNSY